MRESYTASVERNIACEPGFASEPYECAWATEAIFFIRFLDPAERPAPLRFGIDLSPDGMRWCPDPDAVCEIGPTAEVGFVRATHFGGWLRVRRLDDAGGAPKVLVHLVLK